VARDADEAGLARLLLLQKPREDAVGVQGDLHLAVADLVEVEQVHAVGFEEPERIGQDLLRRGHVVGQDLGRKEDLLAAAAERQAYAFFGDVVGGRRVDGGHAEVDGRADAVGHILGRMGLGEAGRGRTEGERGD